jgi:hypothetical protein
MQNALRRLPDARATVADAACGGPESAGRGPSRSPALSMPLSVPALSRSAGLALGATLLMTPLFGQLAAAAFSGRYARSLPARSPWIVGLAGALVAFAFLALRWLVSRASSTDWQANGGATRPCYLTMLVLVVLAVSFAAADRDLLSDQRPRSPASSSSSAAQSSSAPIRESTA